MSAFLQEAVCFSACSSIFVMQFKPSEELERNPKNWLAVWVFLAQPSSPETCDLSLPQEGFSSSPWRCGGSLDTRKRKLVPLSVSFVSQSSSPMEKNGFAPALARSPALVWPFPCWAKIWLSEWLVKSISQEYTRTQVYNSSPVFSSFLTFLVKFHTLQVYAVEVCLVQTEIERSLHLLALQLYSERFVFEVGEPIVCSRSSIEFLVPCLHEPPRHGFRVVPTSRFWLVSP